MKHSPDGAPHLGGHANITHTDEGALEYLESLGYTSLWDIGCGPGAQTRLAIQRGWRAMGIDGDPRIQTEHTLLHDFTKGKPQCDPRDVAWSTEFLEHVEEQYQANYMAVFQQCKIAVVTYAPPGAKGHHHVNCRTEGYWKLKFKEYGFEYSPKHTEAIRQASTMTRDFVRETGLVFLNANT